MESSHDQQERRPTQVASGVVTVDPRRFELLTSSMRTRRATNCAKGPCAAEATQTRIKVIRMRSGRNAQSRLA